MLVSGNLLDATDGEHRALEVAFLDHHRFEAQIFHPRFVEDDRVLLAVLGGAKRCRQSGNYKKWSDWFHEK